MEGHGILMRRAWQALGKPVVALSCALVVMLWLTTITWSQSGNFPPSSGGGAFPQTVSGTVNSGGIPCFTSSTQMSSSAAITAGDIIQGGGVGACAADSNVLVSNVMQLATASTQTAQCTGATNCFIFKQSSGGGNPFAVQNSGGASILGTSVGGTFAVTAGLGFGFSGAFGNGGNSHIMISLTAPSIAAGGCGGSGASITVNNGTAAFKVGVGTTNTGVCTVTMPTASTDWNCSATDITTISTTVSQTRVVPGGTPATQISLANFTDVSGAANWVDNDVIQVRCMGE